MAHPHISRVSADKPQTVRIDGIHTASRATLIQAPPALEQWPNHIPRAKRNNADEIGVQFSKNGPPRYLSAGPQEEPKPLSPTGSWIIQEIKKNRSAVACGFIRLEGGQYTYPGDNRMSPVHYHPFAVRSDPDGPRDYYQKIIWEELDHEGAHSAVWISKETGFSLGKGFHFGRWATRTMGNMLPLLESMFAHPAVAQVFLAYGIAYTPQDQLIVVNTETGYCETGWNGLALIQTQKNLLGVFALIAEAPSLGTLIANAKWIQVMNKVGDLPEFVSNWAPRLIQFTAHLLWLNRDIEWHHFCDCTTISDVLFVLAKRTGTLMPCGAYRVSGVYIEQAYLQRFGDGIAWQALQDVSKAPVHFSKEMILDHSANNRKNVAGGILFPQSTTAEETLFYPFDWIFGNERVALEDATITYLSKIHTQGMRRLVATLNAAGPAQLQKLKANYSPKCIERFGGRPLLVIEALLIKNRAHRKRIDFLNGSEVFRTLHHEEQIELKRSIGLKGVDLPRHLLEQSRFCEYIETISRQDTPSLLETISPHASYAAELTTHIETNDCACRHNDRVALALLTVQHESADRTAQHRFLKQTVESHTVKLPDIAKAALWEHLDFTRPGPAKTPELPLLKAGKLHEYIHRIDQKGMSDLLHTLLGHVDHLFEILSHYRECCIYHVGERLGIAIEAVEMHSMPMATREHFANLTKVVALGVQDRGRIRQFLHLPPEPEPPTDPEINKWERGDKAGYIATLSGRTMPHLLSTLVRHTQHIYEIHHYFEAQSKDYFGERLMTAILAVEQTLENSQSKQTFIDSCGSLQRLSRDEQKIIRKFLKV